MSSSKAATVQSHLFTGVDTDNALYAFVNLTFDLMIASGTSDGSNVNPFADVIQKLESLASPNSTAAIRYLKELLNTPSEKFNRVGA